MIGFKFTLTLQADGLYGGIDSYGNWVGMTGQLQSNNVDIIASGYTITSAREAVTDFTVPFMCYNVVTVTQPNADLNNIKYAVWKGNDAAAYLQNSADPVAKKIWANIQANAPASLVQNNEAGLELVRQGGWALVCEDANIGLALQNSNGQLVVTGSPVQIPRFYALGVRLGDKLGKTLSINMAKMVESGQMQQLLVKWGFAK